MKNTIKHPLQDTSSEGSLASGSGSALANDDDGASFHSSSSAVDVSSWCKIRFRTTTASKDGRDVIHLEDATAMCLTSDGVKLMQTRQNKQKQGSNFTHNKSNNVVAAVGFAVDASSGDVDQFVRPAATAHRRQQHHDGHDKIWMSQFDTMAEMNDVARHAADLGGLGLICSVTTSPRPDGAAANGDWGQLPLPVFLVVNSNDGSSSNNNNNSVSSLSMALATMKAGNSSITVEITMADDHCHDNFEIAGGDTVMGDDGITEEKKPPAIRDEISTDRPRQRRGNSFDDERNSKQLLAASSGSFPTLQGTRGTSSSSSSSPDDMQMYDDVNELSNARSFPDDEIHYCDLDGPEVSALMGPVVTSVSDGGNAVEVMDATTAPVSWLGMCYYWTYWTDRLLCFFLERSRQTFEGAI
jgi:hypothetical protein